MFSNLLSSCVNPPKEDPFKIVLNPSNTIEDFCKLSSNQKRKVCRQLPVGWKLFLNPTLKKKKRAAKVNHPDEVSCKEVATQEDNSMALKKVSSDLIFYFLNYLLNFHTNLLSLKNNPILT